ncbi:unnamed protein product, partial [Owenia fusiformis]
MDVEKDHRTMNDMNETFQSKMHAKQGELETFIKTEIEIDDYSESTMDDATAKTNVDVISELSSAEHNNFDMPFFIKTEPGVDVISESAIDNTAAKFSIDVISESAMDNTTVNTSIDVISE